MNGRCRLGMGFALLAGLGSARLSAIDFTVNSAADVHDAALDGVCETAAGNGICTLRAAVEELDGTVAMPHRVFLPALTFVVGRAYLEVGAVVLPDWRRSFGLRLSPQRRCVRVVCLTTTRR